MKRKRKTKARKQSNKWQGVLARMNLPVRNRHILPTQIRGECLGPGSQDPSGSASKFLSLCMYVFLSRVKNFYQILKKFD